MTDVEGELTTPRLLGIDIGTSSTTIAYITAKGTSVEIVQNEVSMRQSATLVGFGERQRMIGDEAASSIRSNFKNTVRSWKHLIGPGAPKEDEEFWSLCQLVDSTIPSVIGETDGDVEMGDSKTKKEVGFSVKYRGQERVFTAVQILAMYFTKVRVLAENWIKWGKGENEEQETCQVVVSCPSYYTHPARQAIMDAATLANFHVLRIISDGVAACLAYGPYRMDEFPEEGRMMAFCSCGHSFFTVCVAKFMKNGVQVLSEVCDKKLGGREMDLMLLKYFAKEFEEKNKLEIGSTLRNKKSLLKLEEAVKKTKATLSANEEAPLTVECLSGEYDLASKVTRDKFEEVCEPLYERLINMWRECFAGCKNQGVEPDGIDFIEMIGGASRVPWVRKATQQFFRSKALSFTMNADEAIARGCALQAAMLSPFYRVNDFKVWDTCSKSISIKWKGASDPNEQDAEIFAVGTELELTKQLTFFRSASFSITYFYTDSPSTELGTYNVILPAIEDGERRKITVVAWLNRHGLVTLTNPQMVLADGQPSVNLELTTENLPGYGESELNQLLVMEKQMQAETEEVRRVEELRNDLEGAILKYRKQAEGKPDGPG